MRYRRPGPRAASAALAAALAAATLAMAWAAAPAGARQEEEPPPPTISLAGRGGFLADDAAIPLDLTVEGDAAGRLIRVRVHRTLRDAEELRRSLDEDVGVVLRAAGPVPVEELAIPGPGQRRFELSADDVPGPGVHAVVAQLIEPTGVVLDEVRTPIIRLGSTDDPLPGPALQLVVDVAASATLRPAGRAALTDATLDRFDRLATLLAADGPALTVLALPDTVEALAASTDPRARRLLATLGELPPGSTAVSAPYVPVSARALVDAGLSDALVETVERGEATVRERLVGAAGVELDASIWPDDDVDAPAARLLFDRGRRAVLVRSGRLADDGDTTTEPEPDDGPPALVPAGPYPIADVPGVRSGGVDALVTDDQLADDLVEPAPDRVDAAHVVAAELLLRGDDTGDAVIVRIDDAPGESALLTTLPLLTDDSSPVRIVPLDATGSAGHAGDDPAGDRAGDGTEGRPAIRPAPSPLDLTDLAPRYGAVRDRLAGYDELVVGAPTRTAELRLQLLTALGTELQPEERDAQLAHVDDTIATAIAGIGLTGRTDLNLTSRSGDLPVSIRNDNDHAVRVMVRIRSDRLRFPEGEEFTVEVDPDVTRVDVAVEALATGSVPTFVELWTPDGRTRIDAQQLNVRSTAFSGVGLAISIGALLVLAVWWIRSWRRSRMARTRDTNPLEPDVA